MIFELDGSNEDIVWQKKKVYSGSLAIQKFVLWWVMSKGLLKLWINRLGGPINQLKGKTQTREKAHNKPQRLASYSYEPSEFLSKIIINKTTTISMTSSYVKHYNAPPSSLSKCLIHIHDWARFLREDDSRTERFQGMVSQRLCAQCLSKLMQGISNGNGPWFRSKMINNGSE